MEDNMNFENQKFLKLYKFLFDDEEFSDVNQFFSNKELLELLDKIKKYLYESH